MVSATVIVDNVYQLLVARSLETAGILPYSLKSIVSIGGSPVLDRAAAVAGASGIAHLHIDASPSPTGQILRAIRLSLEARPVDQILRSTTRLVVFNDTHPCTVVLCRRARHASISLIEEGIAVHRRRPVRWRSPMWLGRLIVPGLNVSGRHGEASWIDELWVTDSATLSPVQRQKRVHTFPIGRVIEEIRRQWRIQPLVPNDGRPVLMMLGQPFVEDGVLHAREFAEMLTTIAQAIPDSARLAMLRVYKPHPRERNGESFARLALGADAVLLDQHVPVEAMDFEGRRLLLIAFTSGGLRNLTEAERRISVAGCFPQLAREIGTTMVFPGVTFLSNPSQLANELADFLNQSHDRSKV